MGREGTRMDERSERPRRVRILRQRRQGPRSVQRDAARRSPDMTRPCRSKRLITLTALLLAATRPAASQDRPASDSSFAGLVARLSEQAGYFDSDNIISNESSYLQIASQLAKVGTHGGVYVGVGPDQSFSYIALIRPSIAFMLDIRRDNMLEHLFFKSLFSLSRNRLEYLLRLFGKPIPADIDVWTDRPA